VFKLVNLFTEESYLYYEALIEELQRMYRHEDGAVLEYFVLDIGCRLRAWWDR
jgi:hypothetical protein